jgi:hypothetical protein
MLQHRFVVIYSRALQPDGHVRMSKDERCPNENAQRLAQESRALTQQLIASVEALKAEMSRSTELFAKSATLFQSADYALAGATIRLLVSLIGPAPGGEPPGDTPPQQAALRQGSSQYEGPPVPGPKGVH